MSRPIRKVGGPLQGAGRHLPLLRKHDGNRRMPRCGVVAAIILAIGALAAATPSASASALAEVLKTGTADRLDLSAIDRLYDEAVSDGDGVGRTVRRLRIFANAPARQAKARTNILLAIAHLHWRQGDPDSALAAADAAWDMHQSVDGALLKARLLDASGDPAGAVVWYQHVAANTTREHEKEFVALRLTIAQATERNVDALVELASKRGQDFRNRAAIALAVLGHSAHALALYRVADTFGDLFRQQVRLAEWAIAAGSLKEAQTLAWRALEVAGPRADRLYTLAVLVEAYREDGALNKLLSRLGAAVDMAPELVETRVDLLIETGQYDEAIRYYETIGVDIAARQRLLTLYEAAGRTEDMVAEYRRLMTAEPRAVHWFAGLAGHYMNIAEPTRALGVWQALEVAGGTHPPTLLKAAEQMVEMGFTKQAVDMVERQMATDGEHADGLLFLADVRRGQGRDEEALASLQRLETLLPADNDIIRDLIDGYERLNKPQVAIRLLEQLRAKKGKLGYDEHMRLAWLYSVAGRKPEALATWRSLWTSVDSPARRSLVENQMLLLAAELNTLADIVVELEEKLARGDVDKNEMNLLARIYTEVGDSLSATEVIDEFARLGGGDDVERLRQLGRVHMLLKDYSAYDQVLRQLIEADPQNEAEHVQNLVLNMLAYDLAEDSDERFADIQRWLTKLRAFDAEGVSGEFEAGVLSLGGFHNEAIESYRRALVQQPQNSDNLLLMAEMMKLANRRDEAVSLLQYAAEHAMDDNAFVVAMDGIVNMIGRSFADRLTPVMRRTFRWAQRIILERVTGRADKFFLYQLLADIAQETGDIEGEFLALENSLSQAGLRRPAILRELVTLATPNTGFGGLDTGGGDRDRQLKHGRRLIGLRQALPPEVYIDLGKVLLERGDLAGAEKAFDSIDDITGLIDVNKTKADLLHEAGYSAEALNYYTHALSVKPDDLTLLAKTALLRETNGQLDVANRLYERALGNVLRTQAATAKAKRPGRVRTPMTMVEGRSDLAVTRDYRTYFETLAQGFLVTWPQDQAIAAERLAAVRAMFDDAMKSIGEPDGETPLSAFPRLDHTIRFVRRVAEYTGNAELRRHMDAVRTAFAGESEEASTAPGGNLAVLERHFALAKRHGDFGTAARLARLLGDEDRIADLLRERIAEGKYQEGISLAWATLSPAAFRRIVSPFAATLKDNKPALLSFITDGGDWLALNVEQRLGHDLIEHDELQRLAGSPLATQVLDAHGFGNGTAFWRYLKAKVGVDAQIRYLANIVHGFEGGSNFGGAYVITVVLEDLLVTKLTPAQQRALIKAAIAYAAKIDLPREFAAQEILRLLLKQVPAQNQEMLYALAEPFARRGRLGFDLGQTLRTIYEGDPDDGFDALLDLGRRGLLRSGFSAALGIRDFTERFAEQKEKLLARIANGEQVDAATANLIYELELRTVFYVRGEQRTARARRLIQLAPHLMALDPDESEYRRALVAAHLSLGERTAAEQALLDYQRIAPEDELLRGAVYFYWLSEGRFAQALALAIDGGADYRDETTVEALLEQAKRRGANGSSADLFWRFYTKPVDYYSPHYATLVRDINRLQALADGTNGIEHARAKALALRAVWRGAFAPTDSASGPRSLDTSLGMLLRLPAKSTGNLFIRHQPRPRGDIASVLPPPAGGEPRRLFDTLANLPFAAAEFDRLFSALPVDARRRNQHLYTLLRKAFAAAPEYRARRLAKLARELRQGTMSDPELALWMALREADETPFARWEVERLEERAATIGDANLFEILNWARLFAKASRSTPSAVDAAVTHYQLVAAHLLRLDNAEPTLDLAVLADELADRLPNDKALEAIRSILAIAHPVDEDADSLACFHAYTLRSLSTVMAADQVLIEANSWAGRPTDDLTLCNGAYAIELARIHAQAGRFAKAISVLRALLLDPPRPAENDHFRNQDDYRRQTARTQFAKQLGVPYSVSTQEMLVAYRERIFPALDGHVWSGSNEWIDHAANALIGWLDDSTLDTSTILDAVLLAAWQQRAAGAPDIARRIFTRAARKIANTEAESNAVVVRQLTLMALKLESPLPLGLAKSALRRGILTAAQEADLVRYLATHSDADATLRIAKAADRGDRLDVLLALLPLAENAADAAYILELRHRIGSAEAARAELGLAPESDPPLTANVARAES